MNQPLKQTIRRPSSPFKLAAGALAVSLMLAACGGADPSGPPDTTAPTVAITDDVAGSATGAVTFTFTFSEDVGTSFTAEDVVVGGGTAGAFTKVSATVYTLVVTPPTNAAGNVTVSVAPAKFKDLALNDNTASTSAVQAYDTTTPAAGGTVLATFDEAVPLAVNVFGGTVATLEAGPAGGGSGQALKLVRNGGEVWAGAWVAVPTVPSNVSSRTITARVYSPTAGVPMVAKLEFGDNTGTGDTQASAPIVAGWQTVSWTFSNLDASKVYNRFVIIPNLGTVDTAKTYYVDDIKLLDVVAPPPPPTTGSTVLATFDEAVPLAVNVFGGTVATLEAGPAGGGSGQALKLVRNGGEVWAGAWVAVPTVPSNVSSRTITARVYSPTAGIPMVAKLEFGDNTGTGDTQASAPIVAGWQTVSWTFNNLDATKVYNRFVIIPNLGTVDTAKTYYVDDVKLLDAAPPPPPPTGGTVLATFDETTPLAVSIFGGTVATLEAGPAGGGTGQALKLVRNGGEVWAGAWVAVPTIPSTTNPRTVTARVYSPTAGIPMVAKLEFGDNTGTGDTQASAPIVVGWQTVSWTFNNLDATKVYNRFVIIPNLGTVDTNKTYYVDDITLADAAGGGGGGSTPGVELGSGGPQTLTVATGDVKTGDGGNTMFVAGEGLFSVNVVGSAETTAPFNLAAWPNAKTANFGSITGISGGDIGYFQDDANLSNSSQKVDEGGWVAGTALSPNGVPNFFRYFVLKGPVSNDAYMGLYVNAPNNGTVNVGSFSKIKLKVWGPAPMFERTNLNPVLLVTLTGPKVAGCTTGSGGSEITQNLTANLKNGAGGFYTMPLSGFTVKGLCGTDTGAASVLAKVARVVVTVPGTSFNYTNAELGNYATGVNLGPVGFTNN